MHDVEDLNRALAAPFRFHASLQAAAFLSGLVVAPIAAQFTSRGLAIAVGALAMILAVGSYWTWWIRSRYPPAIEAIADHNRLEAAAWRRETGSDLPCSRAQAGAWLRAHPRTGDDDPVDLVPARSAFAALSDPLDRRHGRVCLGLLEARLALVAGGDPFEPILAARAAIDTIDRDVSTAATSRRLALILAVAVVAFAAIALAVS